MYCCVWEVGVCNSNTKGKGKLCTLNVDQGFFQDLKKDTEELCEHEKSQVTKQTSSCTYL